MKLLISAIFMAILALSIIGNGLAMTVCVKKSTGELIEMQEPHPVPGSLIENAVRSGMDRNDLEEIIGPEAERIYKEFVERERAKNPIK